MRVALLTLAAAAGLVAPAPASAHARSPAVAIDYRLRLEAPPPGLHVRILDGDRSLEASVADGRLLLVRGYLHEPMLRIGGDGVFVNASSPTAQTDKIVSGGAGWVHVSTAPTFAWHEHRLTPAGSRGRFSIPVQLDGRPAAIAGTFVRVPRPALWPWLAGAAVAAAGVLAAARHRALRLALTLSLGVLAGMTALLAAVGFAVRDQPAGGTNWLSIGATSGVALAFAIALLRVGGRRRAHAAGLAGAASAAVTLASLPVFWHGVVISALPGGAARLACACALVGGASAAALSLLPEFDA